MSGLLVLHPVICTTQHTGALFSCYRWCVEAVHELMLLQERQMLGCIQLATGRTVISTANEQQKRAVQLSEVLYNSFAEI